jgi:hypothetical protein
MNLNILNSGTTDTKPWLNPVVNNIDAKTINNNEPFIASVFGGQYGGPIAYTLGTIVSGSSSQTILSSTPPSDWTIGDCSITYNGVSGKTFYYFLGGGFATDISGTYNSIFYINGIPYPNNLGVSYAVAGAIGTVGLQGLLILNTGDLIQLSFDKGSDIVGAPTVSIFGCGFNFFKVG